jgi:hypothetical protein
VEHLGHLRRAEEYHGCLILIVCLRRLGSIKPSPEITFGDGDRRTASHVESCHTLTIRLPPSHSPPPHSASWYVLFVSVNITAHTNNPPGPPHNNTSRLHRRPRLRTSIRRGIQAGLSITSTLTSTSNLSNTASNKPSEIRRSKPRQRFRLRLPLLLRPHPRRSMQDPQRLPSQGRRSQPHPSPRALQAPIRHERPQKRRLLLPSKQGPASP